LLRTFPGRALELGLAIKAITWPVNLFSTLPPALEAIDMVGSLALLFALAYGTDAIRGLGEAPLLWRVRRRLILSYVFVGVGAGAAGDHVLPARRVDPRVQRELVSRAVARPQPDRPGALPGADRAARSAARHQRGALAETLERRQSSIETRYPFVSIAIVPVSNLSCKVEPAQAARVPKALPVPLPVTRRSLGPPDPPTDAAEVGRLRRLQRTDRLQRAGQAGATAQPDKRGS
jgi:hypothetical protein